MPNMSEIYKEAESERNGSEIYYNAPQKEYVSKNQRGAWISRGVGQLKRYLKGLGYNAKPAEKWELSEIDQKILNTEELHDVNYVGALAGKMEGFHIDGETRILVTHSPNIIQPVEGDWETLRTLIEGMFNAEQRVYLYGWLHFAYTSLVEGALTPGQALAIAGKAGSGKSLFQNLITFIMGGRAASPYMFMTGASSFNSDLFGAEHLMIEDVSAMTDLKSRRHMGQLIKNFTVCSDQRCHAKGMDAIMLHPYWRLTITMNDEPEHLMVLPPIDESIVDKIILLRAEKKPMPMSTASIAAKALFYSTLKSNLPAFIHFLVNFSVPEELKCERFGIKHYHHRELIQEINALSPEHKLLNMIEAVIIAPIWEGSSMELETALTKHDSAYSYEAKKLLSWGNATGTYLGRLERRYPNRFIHHRTMKGRTWTIYPQAKNEEKA